jgi:RNA recognition motif-containing protein
VTLSWWQKILKAIGLYKEPVRPPRPERRPDAAKPQADARAPKSNVRNARRGDGGVERPAERAPKRERERTNRGGERSRGGDASTVESARVYVGNLSYDVSEQDLQELFKGIGGVRNVEIVYNRSTHRSKGYGFVEMLHKDEAVRSVEVLHDQPFMGRKLVVSGAKSKGQDDREDHDERPERESHVVSLAPLPAAVSANPQFAEEEEIAVEDEPVIQTIVEAVTQEAPPTDLVEEPEQTEPKSEVA